MKLDELMKERGKFWLMVIAGTACFLTSWVLYIYVPFIKYFAKYAQNDEVSDLISIAALLMVVVCYLVFVLLRAAFVYFLFYRLTFIESKLPNYLMMIMFIIIVFIITLALITNKSIASIAILYAIYVCLVGLTLFSFRIASNATPSSSYSNNANLESFKYVLYLVVALCIGFVTFGIEGGFVVEKWWKSIVNILGV